jgi:hypothetical protein
MVYSRHGDIDVPSRIAEATRRVLMNPRVKITPRIAAPVARRLRLAASMRSSSMSAVVNDVLDEALPSLDEIRAQLAAPAAREGGSDAGSR